MSDPKWKAIKARWKDELDQDKETNAVDWKDFDTSFFQIICIPILKREFSQQLLFVDVNQEAISAFIFSLLLKNINHLFKSFVIVDNSSNIRTALKAMIKHFNLNW